MIDWNKPMQEIAGLPGAKYQQGDRHFDAGGNEVLVRQRPRVEWDSDGREMRTIETYVERPEAAAVPEPEPATSGPERSAYEAMPVRELKALMDSIGQPWIGREAAIAFLRANAAP